jgi:hypothetical protein
MAVELWKHQCTTTGKEEINMQGQTCPHCGATQPEPVQPPGPTPEVQ